MLKKEPFSEQNRKHEGKGSQLIALSFDHNINIVIVKKSLSVIVDSENENLQIVTMLWKTVVILVFCVGIANGFVPKSSLEATNRPRLDENSFRLNQADVPLRTDSIAAGFADDKLRIHAPKKETVGTCIMLYC